MSELPKYTSERALKGLRSYGVRGLNILNRYILMMIPYLERETGVPRGKFDDYEAFVRSILVSEVAAVLIAEDYDCTLEEGYHIAWLSETYGMHEYPSPDRCSVLKKLHASGARDFLLKIAAEEGWSPEDVGLVGPDLLIKAPVELDGGTGQRRLV